MSIYLAIILGSCALATPSFAAPMRAQLPQLNQEMQPAPDAAPAGSPQEPLKNDAPQNTAPPAQQPGAEPQSEPTPPPQTKPAPKVNPSEPQRAQPEPAAKKPESKASKKTPRRKKRHRKTCAPPTETSDKKVVRNGGTVDPVVQLAPGMSAEQASSQRQSTTQLLAATDDNLKQIASRQLSSAQQDSVSQIRKYIEQANAAEKAGDVQRAHNLASKALLLSDDLVKH
jgi:hypothetical protein